MNVSDFAEQGESSRVRNHTDSYFCSNELKRVEEHKKTVCWLQAVQRQPDVPLHLR